MTLPEKLVELLAAVREKSGRVVVLTGAGISAESGIPTFRGADGFWTVGSQNYHPQELATARMFFSQPEVLWPWYLYRRSVCRSAIPNAAHDALARLEAGLDDRFVLVTQNVDGLHLRAGNSCERTWEIHGNIDYMRCGDDCNHVRHPVPTALDDWPKDRLFDRARDILACAQCGAMMRPHVLWFDEMYDEPLYRFESSIRAAYLADVLIIVGTEGATTLPNEMARVAENRGVPIVDINPSDNVFARLARSTPGGVAVQGSAGSVIPTIVERLVGNA